MRPKVPCVTLATTTSTGGSSERACAQARGSAPWRGVLQDRQGFHLVQSSKVFGRHSRPFQVQQKVEGLVALCDHRVYMLTSFGSTHSFAPGSFDWVTFSVTLAPILIDASSKTLVKERLSSSSLVHKSTCH